jgi:hypothetical protein
MKPADAERYLDETRGIEGWFFPIDLQLFALIDEIQKREGIEGNLFEIGVHHGKSAALLARMARDTEVLGVCDVFDRQELNVDRSGDGSRELFARNLSGFDPSRLRVFAMSSHEVRTSHTTSECRFLHIDGGHRPVDVVNDLRVAHEALHARGVVALDDVFNPSWPGVSEGFYRFVSDHADTFVPIAIGGNKVFLTRPDAASVYERHWGDAAALTREVALRAFEFQWKEWLGRSVITASRITWVDLDPAGAAALHSRSR